MKVDIWRIPKKEQLYIFTQKAQIILKKNGIVVEKEIVIK